MHAVLRQPALALVLAAALWGGAVSGTKFALRGFDSVTLLSIELAAATAALWAVMLVRGYRPPPSWRAAALLGLLEPALAYLGDAVGLSRTSAVDGSIISGLESALVVILAVALLREAITRPAILAVALALGGVAMLAGAGGQRAAIGDLCIAGGMLSASLYSVVAKRFSDGSDPLSLTTWQFSASTLVLLSVAGLRWIAGPEHQHISAKPQYWLAAAAVGVGGFALSFLLYNRTISMVDAGWAAIVLNLIPVFGLLSAVICLGEKLTRASGIGAALIAISVIYFTISDRRDSARTAAPSADPSIPSMSGQPRPREQPGASGRQIQPDAVSGR